MNGVLAKSWTLKPFLFLDRTACMIQDCPLESRRLSVVQLGRVLFQEAASRSVLQSETDP
jgi:hypothetical protein